MVVVKCPRTGFLITGRKPMTAKAMNAIYAVYLVSRLLRVNIQPQPTTGRKRIYYE